MRLTARFSKITRAALMSEAPKSPVAVDRFVSMAAAADVAALGEVRTSAAFALRFDTEAASSGLALDLAPRSVDHAVKVCHACGMQAGRFDERCSNCRADLTCDAQSETDAARRLAADHRDWQEQVRTGLVPEARFARVLDARPLPSRPWKLTPALAKERFDRAAANPSVAGAKSILARFLGAFVTNRGGGR